tara:strand:+ start:120 stop:527 length:408 start_codon:yes stop_codon:yes gene_type:complete
MFGEEREIASAYPICGSTDEPTQSRKIFFSPVACKARSLHINLFCHCSNYQVRALLVRKLQIERKTQKETNRDSPPNQNCDGRKLIPFIREISSIIQRGDQPQEADQDTAQGIEVGDSIKLFSICSVLIAKWGQC